MPRPEINDYIFYKIVNDDLPEYIYIGSTACFSKRKRGHKTTCNNSHRPGYNLKLYQTIRENGGWDKWQMIVIDKLDQTTLLNARIKEESLRKEYNGNLNTIKAYRTDEERKEDVTKYNKANKEAITEKVKEYRDNNKIYISEKQKEYRDNNREVLIEYHKNYRQKNKESINEKAEKKAREKVTCECGVILRKDSKWKHEKSLKHQQFCQPIDLSII